MHIYRTQKVRKEIDRLGIDLFRYSVFTGTPKAAFRFPRQELQPKLRKVCYEEDRGQHHCRWVVSCDFTKAPTGEYRQIIVENQPPGDFWERG